MNGDSKGLQGQFIDQLVQNLRTGSQGDNIFEDEKEQKFDNIPLLKPPVNYKNVVKKFETPAKCSSTESSVVSSRHSSPDISEDSISV